MKPGVVETENEIENMQLKTNRSNYFAARGFQIRYGRSGLFGDHGNRVGVGEDQESCCSRQ
jgi:hypothetical protein